MAHDGYLAKGYPIASGVVEDRMECTGMRWSMDGAQAVLDLRSVSLSTATLTESPGACNAVPSQHAQRVQQTLTNAGLPPPKRSPP